MFGFKKRFISLLIRHQIIDAEQLELLSKEPFHKKTKNSITRHEFFYNAFYLLSCNNISGDYIEFGCYGGMTFNHAYKESQRHGNSAKLWAFDSFQGLPAPKNDKDIHPCWHEGAMQMSLEEFHLVCKKNNIPKDAYQVVPGFYDLTLKNLGPNESPSNIALAYIDCDLYSSTIEVLDFLHPRLKHGMLIAFDDYFMYSHNQISGNRKAMLESFPVEGEFQLLPYMQYAHVGQSFIIEDKKITNQL